MDDRPWDGPAPPAVVYVFAEDRKGERATDLFAGFNGILQVDGYTGYNGLLDPQRPGGPVTFAFCFAHSRRKFYDVHVATGSPIAAEAVRLRQVCGHPVRRASGRDKAADGRLQALARRAARGGILGSPHNPKFLWVDDAEIVGDRIAEDCPVFRYLLAQEMQNRSAELVVGRVAAVVGYVPMHQSP